MQIVCHEQRPLRGDDAKADPTRGHSYHPVGPMANKPATCDNQALRYRETKAYGPCSRVKW